MKRYRLILIGLVLVGLVVGSAYEADRPEWTKATPIVEVLHALGESYPTHYLKESDSTMIQRGKELIMQGQTTGPKGRKTPIQSKHFKCVSCHNIEQEEPDLAQPDPVARLAYADKNDMPFLQGTTLFGVVNRESWYNGDYLKKYGADLIKPARDSLRAAIQVCATTCSQGRAYNDWELRAVLSYLWSIQLTLGDLSLSTSDWERLRKARQAAGAQPATVKWLKSFYTQAAPADFVQPPKDVKKGYDYEGDPEKGAIIYTKSCLHCHKPGGVAKPVLDNSPMTYTFLLKRFNTYDWNKSLYPLLRQGTHPKQGDRDYMPNYTNDRLTDQQIEHFRAFIEKKAASS